MGAFILCKTENQQKLNKAESMMKECGFTSPEQYKLGPWALDLYPKKTETMVQTSQQGQHRIFVVGTLCYRALKLEESLAQLLSDAIDNQIDFEQLYGHYTVLLWINQKLSLLTDPLNVKHVFTDRHNDIFSSSMLAVAAGQDRVQMNRSAWMEKCITGIIISPDTIIDGVFQLNDTIGSTINKQTSSLHYIQNSNHTLSPETYKERRAVQIQKQSTYLVDYLSRWGNFVQHKKVDLGLSAGYDSTLLFAAANKAFGGQLHIHTHSTGHAHDHERDLAERMCAAKGITCHVIPTKRLDESGAEPMRTLNENIAFFDGRTSFDIGGFSQTYSTWYRKAATENTRFTMTGVGGELYRNMFAMSGKSVDADRFFHEHIVDMPSIMLSDEWKETLQHHIRKAQQRLGVPLHGKVDMMSIRRYYCEILMPEGQGHVIDAYNTVSFCIAPFLEQKVVQYGYKMSQYAGAYGKFEGDMIQMLDPQLAGMTSSYGFAFDHVPLSQRIKMYARSHLSVKIWNHLSNLRGKGISGAYRYYQSVAAKEPQIADCVDRLRMITKSDIPLESMMKYGSRTNNIVFFACLCEKMNITEAV